MYVLSQFYTIVTNSFWSIQEYPCFFGIGNEGAVCVRLKDNIGVVYVANDGRILCCTCKYQKHACPHVEVMVESAQKIDSPAILKPFSRGQPELNNVTSSAPKCLSKTKTSFLFANSVISSILQLPFNERFCIHDGICHLGMDPGPCEVCSLSSWHTKNGNKHYCIKSSFESNKLAHFSYLK